jgi:hypothetical protein
MEWFVNSLFSPRTELPVCAQTSFSCFSYTLSAFMSGCAGGVAFTYFANQADSAASAMATAFDGNEEGTDPVDSVDGSEETNESMDSVDGSEEAKDPMDSVDGSEEVTPLDGNGEDRDSVNHSEEATAFNGREKGTASVVAATYSVYSTEEEVVRPSSTEIQKEQAEVQISPPAKLVVARPRGGEDVAADDGLDAPTKCDHRPFIADPPAEIPAAAVEADPLLPVGNTLNEKRRIKHWLRQLKRKETPLVSSSALAIPWSYTRNANLSH